MIQFLEKCELILKRSALRFYWHAPGCVLIAGAFMLIKK